MFPILYQNQYFVLTTMGVLGALGFFLAVYLLIKFSNKKQLDLQFIVDHFWSFILVTFLFARLEVILINSDIFFRNVGFGFEEMISGYDKFFSGLWFLIGGLFFQGGVGFWGGVIGFLLVLFVQAIRLRESFGKWLDVVIVSILPAIALGYLGQFFDGAGYGVPTHLPWGFAFENIAVPYTIPIHPVQIYIMIAAMVAFGIAWLFFKKKSLPGLAGLVGLISFALMRFGLDFLRGDVTLVVEGLRLQQWFSLVVILILVLFFFISRRSSFK